MTAELCRDLDELCLELDVDGTGLDRAGLDEVLGMEVDVDGTDLDEALGMTDEYGAAGTGFCLDVDGATDGTTDLCLDADGAADGMINIGFDGAVGMTTEYGAAGTEGFCLEVI